jgi:hypothetical protein
MVEFAVVGIISNEAGIQLRKSYSQKAIGEPFNDCTADVLVDV